MHFTEYDTRVAAYAVIVDDSERVLLSWYNGEGRHRPGWSLPGGGIELEETLVEGLVREVHEETGFDVEVGDPLATHAFHDPAGPRPPRPYKGVKVVFEATVVGGLLGTVEVGGSTDFAQWVPLADLDGDDTHRADVVDVALAAWRLRHRPAG